VSASRGARRRRTGLWFVVYTLVLLVIVGVSIASHQWSVAVTTLAITLVFALITRGLWRRR
jgi:hypothetical protein